MSRDRSDDTLFIPLWLEDADLTDAEYRVLCRVHFIAAMNAAGAMSRKKWCDETVPQMATATRMSEDKVRRARQTLALAGVLAVTEIPGGADRLRVAHPKDWGDIEAARALVQSKTRYGKRKPAIPAEQDAEATEEEPEAAGSDPVGGVEIHTTPDANEDPSGVELHTTPLCNSTPPPCGNTHHPGVESHTTYCIEETGSPNPETIAGAKRPISGGDAHTREAPPTDPASPDEAPEPEHRSRGASRQRGSDEIKGEDTRPTADSLRADPVALWETATGETLHHHLAEAVRQHVGRDAEAWVRVVAGRAPDAHVLDCLLTLRPVDSAPPAPTPA